MKIRGIPSIMRLTSIIEQFPGQKSSEDPRKNPELIKQQIIAFVTSTDMRDAGSVQNLKQYLEQILSEL